MQILKRFEFKRQATEMFILMIHYIYSVRDFMPVLILCWLETNKYTWNSIPTVVRWLPRISLKHICFFRFTSSKAPISRFHSFYTKSWDRRARSKYREMNPNPATVYSASSSHLNPPYIGADSKIKYFEIDKEFEFYSLTGLHQFQLLQVQRIQWL